MPDGEWDALLRRDIFMKTSGAVRDYNQLAAVSYYYRVYIAALSALAEQNREKELLFNATVLATKTLTTYISETMSAQYGTSQRTPTQTWADFYYTQLTNATCTCRYQSQYGNATLYGDSDGAGSGDGGVIWEAFNNTNSFNNYGDFETAVCPLGAACESICVSSSC